MSELINDAKTWRIETLWSLIRALEARDPYTMKHSENVTCYAVGIARAMGLSEENVDIIRQAGMVHDIGKIGVPDPILQKAGLLTPLEQRAIRTHVLTGVQILCEIQALKCELPLVRSHHERWDGKGYPEGIAGDAIPLGARILAVVDTLDAITSDRVYRKAQSLQKALEIIADESGKQFDPVVVSALNQWISEISTERQVQTDALTTENLLETTVEALAIRVESS